MGKSQSSKKGKGKPQKSTSKARAHALDAFAIAQKQIEPERLGRRGRDLDPDTERQPRNAKHRRDEDEDEESEDDEDEAPRKKRAKQSAFDDEDGDINGGDLDGGSDSEGNEWHIGVNDDDDDSELDSDEAFGESDDEKFEGYAFRGSNSQKKNTKKKSHDEESEDDDDGDDGDSLGSDAIDLADALDQSSGDEDDSSGSEGDTDSGSEAASASESEVDDDDEVDPSKLGELQNLIEGFAGTERDDDAIDPHASKQTISLEDLGLSGVKDPLIKKSVKMMKKEEKADNDKKGTSKKLDVPLPRRQQDQLLRIAAYEKTNETLDRWNETVKHNRRADHLMFPLPQNAHDAGLDKGELLPLTKNTAGTELEQTILTIMEESGLGPSGKAKEQEAKKTDANGEEQALSKAELKELWAQRRKERELESREQARAKRIKKIKSKTYRKIHRKERLGDEAALYEERRANGEIDSEEERETAHRQRLLERVGAKHKNSKWAKLGKKVGRAVWDDDFRAGLTDMHQRSEELKKRVEGRTDSGDEGQDDSDDASESGEETGKSRLLRDLDGLGDVEGDDDHPHAGLMKLAFMQRAEAQRKQANDELVAQIRRDLESGSEQEEDDETEAQVGRRTFGMGQDKKASKPTQETGAPSTSVLSNGSKSKKKSSQAQGTPKSNASITTAEITSAPGAGGAWTQVLKSKGADRKKGRKATGTAEAAELDLSGAVQLANKPAPAKAKRTAEAGSTITATRVDDGDSSDDEIHLPLALRDHELVSRAFAGEDVAGEFQAEKEAIMSEDDEKMIDNTMPGWGSWTGEGVSKRAKNRHKGKVMTKKEGIKKTDRKDAKLNKVIITEKRVRKVRVATDPIDVCATVERALANRWYEQNEKYLASQMPHPFESRQQYERSLRLPIGPEWMTKQSFQQATKPRVLVKQGIIAPMSKPLL